MTRRTQILAAFVLVALVVVAALVVRITVAGDPPTVKQQRIEFELLSSQNPLSPTLGA
jgi:hypothetical protein